MEILEVANSAEEIKDIWKKQLSSTPDRILEKTESYLKERQGDVAQSEKKKRKKTSTKFTYREWTRRTQMSNMSNSS